MSSAVNPDDAITLEVDELQLENVFIFILLTLTLAMLHWHSLLGSQQLTASQLSKHSYIPGSTDITNQFVQFTIFLVKSKSLLTFNSRVTCNRQLVHVVIFAPWQHTNVILSQTQATQCSREKGSFHGRELQITTYQVRVGRWTPTYIFSITNNCWFRLVSLYTPSKNQC